MSVPVGALASKSRPITAVNWSSVSRTEKSRSPRKLAGNTRRPCRLTTNGFTFYLLSGAYGPPASYPVVRRGQVRDLGPTCLPYPECARYAPRAARLPRVFAAFMARTTAVRSKVFSRTGWVTPSLARFRGHLADAGIESR